VALCGGVALRLLTVFEYLERYAARSGRTASPAQAASLPYKAAGVPLTA
jgi:hypothetical protein